MKYLLAVFLFVLSTIGLHAQTGKISGRVLDATTRQPLPFTNIYVNNTTIGVVANDAGEFTLPNLPAGPTELVFSFIGYVPQQLKLVVKETANAPLTIQLSPDAQQVSEVQVKASRDKTWEKQLHRFEKEFLGNTSSCKILNPWVIDFTPEKSGLTAAASFPVEIENRALGYKLYFQLKKFGYSATEFFILGNIRFTELETTDASVAAKWTKNREHAYRGSAKHLMKSILDRQVSKQGFLLFQDKVKGKPRGRNFSAELEYNLAPVDTSTMILPNATANVNRLAMKDRIEVHYPNEFTINSFYKDISHPVSWLEVKGGYVFVDKEGTILNPTDVAISGSMSEARVSGMLPLDYKPGSLVVKQAPSNLFAKRLQEQAYLHTDKPYYYPGDPVWFSAYMKYRLPGLMDTLSKVLYVDLIKPDQQISQTRILLLESGRAAGSFKLPANMRPGNYVLRAYTHWMRNYGIAPFFYKPITVVALDQRVSEPPAKLLSDSSLAITFNKAAYQKRDKVNMTIRFDTTGQEELLKGSFSVSVVDETVPNPASDPVSIKTSFEIVDPPKNISPQFTFPIETGITIQGIYQDKKGKGKKTALTIIPETMGGLYQVTTGSIGEFALTNMTFYDSTRFVVQPTEGKVKLFPRDMPDLPEKLPVLTVQQVPLKTPHYIYSLDTLQGKTLDAVNVLARKTVKYESSYGQPDQYIKGESIEGYATIAEAIAAKLPSYKLIYDQTNWYLIWARSSVPTSTDIRTGSSLASHEPNLYINNVQVLGETVGDRLMQLNPTLIDHIELNGMITSNQGANGSGGLINVFMRKAAEVSSKPLSTFTVRGFDRPVPFQSVSYDSVTINSGAPDFRPTLYWNPKINLVSTQAPAVLSFFTSDQTGAYRVVVEGMTNQGNPVHTEAVIQVKE